MGIRVESIGISHRNKPFFTSTVDLIQDAASKCFQLTKYSKEDIGLLLNVSVYHYDHIAEPSYASIIQNGLELNHRKTNSLEPKTFSFDVLNGSLGFLNACQIAHAMVGSGKTKCVLIVSGDVVNENEASSGIFPTGAAVLLESTENGNSGFSSFLFRTYTDIEELNESYIYYEGNNLCMKFHKAPSIQKIYIDTIARGLDEYLNRGAARLDEFDYLIPPQISPAFVSGLTEAIGSNQARVIDVSMPDGDLFNASFPKAFAHMIDSNMVSPGQKALILSVGSGYQVGVGTYTF